MVVVHQTSADVGSGNSHAYIAERGDGCPHPVGQGPPIQGYSPIWNSAFRRAFNPAHEPDCLLAYVDHPAVGLFLSLELCCHLGIGYLRLHGQFSVPRTLFCLQLGERCAR
jgi:hypothetical protein